MKLVRNTTDIPDAKVKELLQLAAKGVNHRHVRVEVLNTRFGNSHYIGPGFPKGRIWLPRQGTEFFYYWDRNKHHWCKAWIKVYVPTEKTWAHGVNHNLYTDRLRSREEAFLFIAAHEFYHLRQKRLNDARDYEQRKKRPYRQKPADEWAYRKVDALCLA